jgi:hypothetical protein
MEAFDFPVRKVAINLYESDCKSLERKFGRGWTGKVRDLVHRYVREQHRKAMENGDAD